MDALDRQPRHSSAPFIVATALAAIIGVPIGLYGSIFGPYYAMAVGAVLVVVGLIAILRGARGGRIVLIFGAAVVIGAALYIAIGILTPDGVSSGFSTGCAPGGACE